jgi:predicted nucleotidyltransferase component of viral defense system
MAIALDEVRRRILIALFSDDELMDTLVLKGGNALALVGLSLVSKTPS